MFVVALLAAAQILSSVGGDISPLRTEVPEFSGAKV
jgi:hypothetical protein